MSGFDRFLRVAAHDFMRTEAGPDPSAHLTREVLSDYRSRRILGTERERIQDHLVACRECADAFLALIARNRALPWWKRAGSYFVGVARQPVPAVLSLAVVVLGFWNVSLERAYRELCRPQVEASVVELFAGPSRGRPEAAKEIPLGRGSQIVTLVLHLPDPVPQATLGLELANSRGAVLWRTDDVHADSDGSVTLSIPRPTIGEARDFRIRMLENGKRSILAIYAVRLVGP
jgi:hypothetical protein